MSITIFFAITAAILGLIVGSFLNVIILRMNTGMGIGGRSQCFSCSKVLSWYELMPILSFILQRGKCRTCRSSISIQYPLVELVTAAVFAVPVLAYGTFSAASFVAIPIAWLLGSVAIVISVYDFKHMVIPWQGIIATIVLGVGIYAGFAFINPHATSGMLSLSYRLLAAVVVPLPFFLIWLFSKGKMFGIGDVELMVPIGFSLGIIQGAYALLIAFWSATIIVGSILFIRPRLLRKGNERIMKKAIPFGPFLLAGWYIVLVFGASITRFATSLFL